MEEKNNKYKSVYAEYKSLRNEILQWQRFRISILTGSIAFFGAVLGWFASSKIILEWHIPSFILLPLIGCVSFLCFYCGKGNAEIGAYIEVYLENKKNGLNWETRLRKFDKKPSLNLNYVIGIVFFILAILSIIVPFYIYGGDFQDLVQYSFKSIILLIILILTLSSIILLTFFSYPRKMYVSRWKKLKESENKKKS